MKPRFLLFLGLALSCLGLRAAETPVAAAAATSAPDRPAVEKLIDDLVNVNVETVGANTKATYMSMFLANDRPATNMTGRGGVSLPPPPPVMRQLTALGVAAVPALLNHLTDARDTKLVILNPGILQGAAGVGLHGMRFGSMTYNDEYDPRYPGDPARTPGNVNTRGQRSLGSSDAGDTYTVKIGDLCYVILGQIVYRNLVAVRYQGTACAVINSPVQNPALAAAARQDWAGLTVAEHRASLEHDLLAGDNPRQQFGHLGALDRLTFYFPDTANIETVQRLGQPLAVWRQQWVDDFIGELLADPNAVSRANMLVTAQKQWGNAFIYTVAALIKRQTQETPPTTDAPGTLPAGWTTSRNMLVHRTSYPGASDNVVVVYPQPQWDRAAEALRTIDAYGWLKAFRSNPPVAATEDISLIEVLGNVPDPSLDAAVVDLFHRAQAMREPPGTPDPMFDRLAQTCLGRLQKNSAANEKAIAEIEASLVKPANPAVL